MKNAPRDSATILSVIQKTTSPAFFAAFQKEKTRRLVKLITALGQAERRERRQNRPKRHHKDPSTPEQRKKMHYSEFLKTRYWARVRKAALSQQGACCQICGKKHLLQVHHLTYEFRGDELNHMDCLQVLCANCHHDQHFPKKNP